MSCRGAEQRQGEILQPLGTWGQKWQHAVCGPARIPLTLLLGTASSGVCCSQRLQLAAQHRKVTWGILPTVLQYPSLLAKAAALPSMADNKILDYTDLSTQLIRFAQVRFAPPTYYS